MAFYIEHDSQLRINVKPTLHLKGPPTAYNNKSDPRGALFISNCNTFGNVDISERHGSQRDVDYVHELFTQIGYEGVTTVRDQPKSELLESLDLFREKEIHEGVDSLVMVFMSHGVNEREFSAHDGGVISVEEVYSKLSNVNCPALAGKPKVFLFQYCRGSEHQIENVEGFELDAGNVGRESLGYPMRKLSDIYLCFSTVSGYVSYRHRTDGSPYVKELCRVLMDYAKDSDINELMTKVNSYLESTPGMQAGDHQAIGCRKKFFFNPKGNQSEDNSSASKEGQLAQLGEAGGSSSFSLGKLPSIISSSVSGAFVFGTGMSDQPAGGSQSCLDDTCSSDAETGNVFFLNNLKGCEEDVSKLHVALSGIGYICHHLQSDSKQALVEQLEEFKPWLHGAVVVFFFGFGYDDHLYIGPSDDDAESFSFKAFCEVFNSVREKGNTNVVFTNTCFKEKAQHTVTHTSLQNPVRETGHFCVKVNGNNKNGSLLTKAILQEIKEEPTQNFSTFAEHITGTIEELEDEEADQYYTDVRFYGVMKRILFPQTMSPYTTPNYGIRESPQRVRHKLEVSKSYELADQQLGFKNKFYSIPQTLNSESRSQTFVEGQEMPIHSEKGNLVDTHSILKTFSMLKNFLKVHEADPQLLEDLQRVESCVKETQERKSMKKEDQSSSSKD